MYIQSYSFKGYSILFYKGTQITIFILNTIQMHSLHSLYQAYIFIVLINQFIEATEILLLLKRNKSRCFYHATKEIIRVISSFVSTCFDIQLHFAEKMKMLSDSRMRIVRFHLNTSVFGGRRPI